MNLPFFNEHKTRYFSIKVNLKDSLRNLTSISLASVLDIMGSLATSIEIRSHVFVTLTKVNQTGNVLSTQVYPKKIDLLYLLNAPEKKTAICF